MMSELTPELIAELRRLEKKATPPPWPVTAGLTEDDYRLVDVLWPHLLALLDAAEAHLATRNEKVKPGGSPPVIKP